MGGERLSFSRELSLREYAGLFVEFLVIAVSEIAPAPNQQPCISQLTPKSTSPAPSTVRRRSARFPLATLELLTLSALDGTYRVLRQPAFGHDFNDITFDADEVTPARHPGAAQGRPGDPSAGTPSSQPPLDLVPKHSGDNFWLDSARKLNG